MIRLMVCALALVLGGCGERVVMTTEYQQVYIPDSLLTGCPAVPWEGTSYRDAGDLAAQRGSALKDCDARFTAARKYQDDLRAKAKAAAAKPGTSR